MLWLLLFLSEFAIWSLIYDLIYPEPVADSTLPPSYIPPSDVFPIPEGGQCSKRYWVDVRAVSTMPPNLARGHDWLGKGTIFGPLGTPVFFGRASSSTFEFVVRFPQINQELSWAAGAFLGLGIYFQQKGQTFYFYQYNNNRLVGTITYYVRYRTEDGSPDNCGSVSPSPEIRERLIPVYQPAPLPNPFPPVVPPRAPIPVPIPPIPRLPPSLPIPPRIILPPIGIDIDVNLNFDFSTTNININIDCENGTGTFPTEPFQNLAKLLYAILYEVRELREVTDRIAEQVDCLARKFCREGKGLYNLPLGKVGYSKRSLFTFARPADEKFQPVGIQVLLSEIQVGAGRRARKFAPNLYSEKALGYYAFQFESGGFGELGEVRFSQSYIPIPERAIAIAFWLEPQAGEGFLYCWYEKIHYQEE
jgi:hypothetical protein